MSDKSFWEGKMIDATGRVGTIKIYPGEQGEGKWEAELSDRKQGLRFQGTIEFIESKDGLSAKAKIADKERGSGEWEAKLNYSNAGSYAQAAALGEYRSSTESAGLPLQHGVIVLWKFS
jgi:hypothetical protein